MGYPLGYEHQLGHQQEHSFNTNETSIFDSRLTKREKRNLATLIINKALQGGKNKTYGAARRKMTKWIKSQGISKEDKQVMVWYIDELFIAGAEYIDGPKRAVDLVKDLRKIMIKDVSHLLDINEEWEGFLDFKTPEKCWKDRRYAEGMEL